ncbi:MAG: phosphoribosylaminoimidazolesuccinocarboxamide synthase [Planctomycetes bacterium]|nr:phosphoribosylaminoimidazolesuccinocarboxamide synthase [Planctomycetota bacterium]MBI3847534.1 phosphoribosylaminoimidazolesuccinocarboxamide synthase [Planctomycetota bacterium]
MKLSTSESPIRETTLAGIPLARRGKVRDVYDLGEHLLLVTTDRISAFDVVLPNGIPFKGKVLNALSEFWFERTRRIVPNHVVTTDVDRMPHSLDPHRAILEGRSLLALKCNALPVECVVRGYLAGSGWKEYRQSRSICGIGLPPGLRECDRLPEPLFTPSTKAEVGHDENISFDRMVEILGDRALAEKLRDLSIAVYRDCAAYAESRGILIADTKMEFGRKSRTGELLLIDELLSPDSSRFWPKDDYEPGRGQRSFDKQIVRDWLESIPWDKKAPAPTLPDDVVERTAARYLEVYERLTGRPLPAIASASRART